MNGNRSPPFLNYYSTPPSSASFSASSATSLHDEWKIYVGNLPYTVTEAALKNYFKKFGEITSAVIVRDKIDGKSRGFGFISFLTREALEKAMKEPKQNIGGRNVCLGYAARQGESSSGTGHFNAQRFDPKKFIVTALADGTSADHIKEYFSRYGTVTSVALPTCGNGRLRGFGFVTMVMETLTDMICYTRFHVINGNIVECRKDVCVADRRAAAAIGAARMQQFILELAQQQMLAPKRFDCAALPGLIPPVAPWHVPPPCTGLLGPAPTPMLPVLAPQVIHAANISGGPILPHHGFAASNRFSPYLAPMIFVPTMLPDPRVGVPFMKVEKSALAVHKNTHALPLSLQLGTLDVASRHPAVGR